MESEMVDEADNGITSEDATIFSWDLFFSIAWICMAVYKKRDIQNPTRIVRKKGAAIFLYCQT